MGKSPWARVTAAVAAVIRLILATPKAQKSLCKPALCMMFLFLMSDLMCSGFCYEALDSESSALSSALLAKEEEESNIFFPFAYNCEWKAHIFFVHRSMHWKAVHLWTQVHQTETFFIILFFQSSRRNCLHPCYCCLVWLASTYISAWSLCCGSFHLHQFKKENNIWKIMDVDHTYWSD